MAKVKILTEARINVDPPRFYYYGGWTPEKEAQKLEAWCRDFNDFIRDHRSQDQITLSVQRVFEDQCSHCHREWEEDEDGMPVCCHIAQVEFESAHVKTPESP